MYPRILQKFDNFLVKTIYKYANRKWYKDPFGKNLTATKGKYTDIWEQSKKKNYPIVDAFEKEKGFAIDKDFFYELALHTQVVIKKSEIVYQHGRLLYSSLRNYIENKNTDFVNIMETGTARGFSALCMAKALEDSGIGGKIVTFDVLPHYTKMFWNCIDDNDGKKTRAELLDNYSQLCGKYIIFHQGNSVTEMKKLAMTRIHYAFLDGGHDYYHVIQEFENIGPFQKQGDIIFFDDYTPEMFSGVKKTVDEICDSWSYKKSVISINKSRAYVIAEKL